MTTQDSQTKPPTISFGREAGMGFEGLTRGLALIGPSHQRNRVLRALASDAMASGTTLVALAIGGDGALLDAGHALAAETGRTGSTFFVDTEADAARTHALSPFHDLDAVALARVLGACNPALAGDGAAQARARGLLACAAPVLVALRDGGQVDPDEPTLSGVLGLRKLIDFTDPDAYPMLPDGCREGIERYLNDLPGYAEERRYRQPQQALDAHQEAVALARLGMSWATLSRFAPLAAADRADLTPDDLTKPGNHTFIRCAPVPSEGSVPSFLASLVDAAIARRATDGPVILVVDGIDALPEWQARNIAIGRAPNVGLVIGLPPHSDMVRTVVPETCWKAVLPGAGYGALSALDPRAPDDDEARRDLAGGDAILGHETRSRGVDMPTAVTDPVRGPVVFRTRPSPEDEPVPAQVETVVANLERLRDPEVRDGIRPKDRDSLTRAATAFRESGEDIQAGAMAALRPGAAD